MIVRASRSQCPPSFRLSLLSASTRLRVSMFNLLATRSDMDLKFWLRRYTNKMAISLSLKNGFHDRPSRRVTGILSDIRGLIIRGRQTLNRPGRIDFLQQAAKSKQHGRCPGNTESWSGILNQLEIIQIKHRDSIRMVNHVLHRRPHPVKAYHKDAWLHPGSPASHHTTEQPALS